MSTARSAGLPAHASFGGLGTTPGRKAPVLSHVLGSPTHPAGRLDSFTTGSLSFSFGSSDHSFNNPALKGSMRCQPTVRTSRPRGAPGAGLKAATSSFSLSSVPAPPTMVKSMSLPVGEFPRRSFVCRLDEFSQKTGLPRVTSSSAIAPLQNSPPPKAPKPTPPSRKRPRYPRGHTEDVKASGNNSGTIITATSTSLSAPTTPAFAPQPMPPLPPACTMSASTQMPGYAAPPAFGPTGGLPSVNDDDDESEILSYLISSDGFESLVSSLQDHNDSPMSPPRQLPRPAVAVPGVASDVHAHHHAHVHAAQNAGLCTQMDGLGVYGSPDIPRAKPAFTTSPFERVRLDCDDTPGAFSLREINERINSPGLLRSRTNSLDSARLPSAAASTSICSFRPIDPQGDVLHAFPMVVPPVEEFRHEEQVPCDLSEDEVGIEIDDEDDQDPLSGSTVEMLFNAFSEAEAAHAAQQQQAHAHAHTHTLTYAHTHSGVPPAAAGACVHPAAGGHAHAASYPPTSMSVLLDTTGCGLGPVEQLRSFSPSILFSGDVPEHTMTL